MYCDHNHATVDARRLPTGGDGAIFVCYFHYRAEKRYRQEMAAAYGGEVQATPPWNTLQRQEE